MLVGAVVLGSTMPHTHCDFASMPYPYSLPQESARPIPTTARAEWHQPLGAEPLADARRLRDPSRPVSPGERQTLVDTYNASLGPPTAEAAPAGPRRAAFSLAVEPTASATGAGLTFAGGSSRGGTQARRDGSAVEQTFNFGQERCVAPPSVRFSSWPSG